MLDEKKVRKETSKRREFCENTRRRVLRESLFDTHVALGKVSSKKLGAEVAQRDSEHTRVTWKTRSEVYESLMINRCQSVLMLMCGLFL